LLYVNKPAFEHFQLLKTQYYRSTHDKDGEVYVHDISVMRVVTNKIMNDTSIRKSFSLLTSPSQFHKDDIDNVFEKYVFRLETMMGIEVSRHYEENLRLSKENKLEQLRVVKRKSNSKIKLCDKKICL